MLFPKGSEWRKWDLHVHSPESSFNNQFSGSSQEEKWANYIDHIEKLTDIAVLGITDYYSTAGYKKALAFQNEGRLRNISLLLPNVEFRLDNITKKGSAINIHVIFDPDIVCLLDSVLFPNIKFSFAENEYSCTEHDLARFGRAYKRDTSLSHRTAFNEGANQFKISLETLRHALTSNKLLKGRYLVICPNSDRDGNSGNQDPSYKALRDERYRFSHCIFSSRQKDIDYFLGITQEHSRTKIIDQYGSLMPCIHGSDAHCLERICKPNDDKFTWIKADPTFEGLKQIIHEPGERVRIQKDSPETKNQKTHFSYIETHGEIFQEGKPTFTTTVLPLNQNMITIIGGRGTGKSLLLDLLYTTFHKIDSRHNRRTDRLKIISSPFFKINITKPDASTTSYLRDITNHPYEYLHVRQGDVAEIAENKTRLAEEILSLLGNTIEYTYAHLQQNIDSLNTELVSLTNLKKKQNSEGEYVNTTSFHEERKKNLISLISTLTTDETKETIKNFIANTGDIAEIDILLHELQTFKIRISQISSEIESKITSLNKNKHRTKAYITLIDFETTRNQISNFEQEVKSIQETLHKNNTEISAKLSELGINGDISGLLDKVSEYQKNISFHENQIAEAKKIDARILEL